MSHHEQKYTVEVRLLSSSGGTSAEANLVDRYEIDGSQKASIAEALRELADELDGDDE